MMPPAITQHRCNHKDRHVNSFILCTCCICKESLHQTLLPFACTSASLSCPLLCSLEGAEWIANKGLWRMPMYHYAALMKALPKVPGVRLDVEPLPPVAQALVQVSQTCWLI